MEKMVEIARYTYPSEAFPLMALLRSEGIACYLRDEISSQVMAGYADIGGARLEILDKDLPKALEIMRDGGYLKDIKFSQGPIERVATIAHHIPYLRDLSLNKQIMILFIVCAVIIALAIYVGSLLCTK